MERNYQQKVINSQQDVRTPANKQNAVKLPKIVTPFGRGEQSSPLSSHNDGLESSMLSYKRRKSPRRPRDNLSSAMSPDSGRQRKSLKEKLPENNDYLSRISGLSSHMELESPKQSRNRRIPGGRNRLPKLNQSVIVSESSRRGETIPLAPPPRKRMPSKPHALSAKRRQKRPTKEASDSGLSSSLLRKIQVDSEKGRDSDSDGGYGDIREARMASRKAIDLLMG